MVPSKWSPRGTGSCSPPDTERRSKPEVPDGGSREITSARTGADRTSDSLLSRKFRERRQREVHAGVKVRAGPVQTAQVRQRGDDHIVGYYRFLMYVISTSSEFPT